MAGMRVYRYDGKTDTFMGITVAEAQEVRQMAKRAGASGGYYVGPEDARGQTLTSRSVTSLSVASTVWDQFVRMFPLRTTSRAQETRATCHYCGMPATGIGFFGEPVCDNCSH